VGQERAQVDLVFGGDGQVVSLAVDGAQVAGRDLACYSEAARKIAFPRFAGTSYQMSVLVFGLRGAPERAGGRRHAQQRP
jgi:hypothetical protein